MKTNHLGLTQWHWTTNNLKVTLKWINYYFIDYCVSHKLYLFLWTRTHRMASQRSTVGHNGGVNLTKMFVKLFIPQSLEHQKYLKSTKRILDNDYREYAIK